MPCGITVMLLAYQAVLGKFTLSVEHNCATLNKDAHLNRRALPITKIELKHRGGSGNLSSFISADIGYSRADMRGFSELRPCKMHFVVEPRHTWETTGTRDVSLGNNRRWIKLAV